MTERVLPYQPEFRPRECEEWGQITLEDETILYTRLILGDLSIQQEDILGPQLAFTPVLAIRSRSPQSLRERVRDRPIQQAGQTIPLSPDSGHEVVEIRNVDRETRSIYLFENYELILTLEIAGVARNFQYQNVSGNPIYTIRWRVNANLERLP